MDDVSIGSAVPLPRDELSVPLRCQRSVSQHAWVSTGPWSDDEINTTVDVYFQMLTLELAEESYVKAEYQREIARTVDRSMGSIGKKLSNISAVLDEINAVWIPGYKPLSNLQGRLREVVIDRFTGDAELRAFMLRSVEDPNIEPSPLGVEVDPPTVDWSERSRGRTGIHGIDFAAIESLNRALGRAGEIAVVEGERVRLSAGGRDDLAAEVRHVSVLDGDGLGYDVQSFQDLTDEPVFIEVKTTRYAKELPFYISGNEVEASNDLGAAYRLRRLYRYGKREAGFYTLLGPLARNAQLKPDVYRGLPAVDSVG